MKVKRKTNNKLIISIFIVAVVAIAAVAGIVTVMAATNHTINNALNIRFIAEDIEAKVIAEYRTRKMAEEGTNWLTIGDAEFFASEDSRTETMEATEIELEGSQNNYVEIRYTFRNYGDADFTGILSMDSNIPANYAETTFAYNNGSYSTTEYGLICQGISGATDIQVEEGTNREYTEKSYSIKVEVTELSKNWSYSNSFTWLLQEYKAQPNEEKINLSATKFTKNADDLTYSASFIEGSDISVNKTQATGVSVQSSNVENLWYIPAKFGSASVTTVTSGVGLPERTKVDIANGVTTIEANAFKDCSGLVEITIPNSVTSIGMKAFAECVNVEILNFNADNVEQGSLPPSINRFGNLGKNVTHTVVNIDAKTLPIYLFNYVSTIDEVNFSNKLTEISGRAFQGCISLTKIIIPSSVEVISDGAFSNCSGLTSITIPASVTSIDGYAFYGCTGLTKIEVDENNATYASEGNCLLNKVKTELIKGCDTSTIPVSVTRIGDSAFYGCTGLTSITIPEGVTSIGGHAFNVCTGLTSVEFENLNGWFVSTSSTATTLSTTGLQNTATAAKYLTSTYVGYVWKRNP